MCGNLTYAIIWNRLKNYLSHNKIQSTADNKEAKIERKEDANTKTTHDVLSKRKPKPSA